MTRKWIGEWPEIVLSTLGLPQMDFDWPLRLTCPYARLLRVDTPAEHRLYQNRAAWFVGWQDFHLGKENLLAEAERTWKPIRKDKTVQFHFVHVAWKCSFVGISFTQELFGSTGKKTFRHLPSPRKKLLEFTNCISLPPNFQVKNCGFDLIFICSNKFSQPLEANKNIIHGKSTDFFEGWS